MVTFSLVVVRHGITDANVQGINQGQSEHRLNEVGRRQALLLGRHFRRCLPFSSFTHSYTSDLARARESAEIILSALNDGIVDGEGANEHQEKRTRLVCDARLRERKYGVLEGKPSTLQKEEARKSNVALEEYTPEGGETLQDLYNRVADFFRDLVWRVVVSSGAVAEESIPCAPPSPMPDQYNRQQRNGTVSSRNARTQMPNAKVSRRSSLQPLPENEGACANANEDKNGGVDVDGEVGLLTSGRGNDRNWHLDSAENEACYNEGSKDIGTIHQADQSPRREYLSPLPPNGEIEVSESSTECPWNSDPVDLPAKRSFSACVGSMVSSDEDGRDTMERMRNIASSKPHPALTVSIGSVSDRKMSVQSITSDDGYIPDLDAKILLVTHGGTMRELFRYFVEELGCVMIGGKGAALRPCPNTGVSSFMVNVNLDNEAMANSSDPKSAIQQKDISVICLGLHSKEHLDADQWSATNTIKKPTTAVASCNGVICADENEDGHK